MERGDHDIGLFPQRGDVGGQPLQILRVGPGHDARRNPGPVRRRVPALHRHLIGGVPADDRDAGGSVAGLVIGRPVDRAALQKSEAHAVAGDDCRGARRRTISTRAGMGDAELVEAGDRRHDRGLAVIDVVGDPDRGDPGVGQGLARRRRIGEKPLALQGVPAGRRVEAAFEIAEDDGGVRETRRGPGRTAPSDRSRSLNLRRRSGSSLPSFPSILCRDSLRPR